MDFGKFVRWGGLLTLSFVTHYYLLSSVDLAEKPTVQPIQQIKISLVALAAPKSVPAPTKTSAANPTEQKNTQKIEKAIAPTPQPAAPKVAVTETAKVAWHKPITEKKHPKPTIEKTATPLPNVEPEKTDPAKPVPTPRLVLRKPTLPKVASEKQITRPTEPALKPLVTPEAPVEIAKIEPKPVEVAKNTPAAPKIDTANVGKQASTASTLHKAKYRKRTPPSYPRRALDLGQQGVVTLAALIEPNGRPGMLKIEQSSGHRLLDKAALAAVKKWEFEPLVQNGQKTSSWVQVPVRFIIN